MKLQTLLIVVCCISIVSIPVLAGLVPKKCEIYSNFTLTAVCDTWEGCGYTLNIPLVLDENGLVIPPADRCCPKCGKWICWKFISENDITNQLIRSEKEE